MTQSGAGAKAQVPPTLSSCRLPLYWEQWKKSRAWRSEHWMKPYEVSSFSMTPVSRSAAEVPLGYPLCPLLWSRLGSKLIWATPSTGKEQSVSFPSFLRHLHGTEIARVTDRFLKCGLSFALFLKRRKTAKRAELF